jgi:hypothetical protein
MGTATRKNAGHYKHVAHVEDFKFFDELGTYHHRPDMKGIILWAMTRNASRSWTRQPTGSRARQRSATWTKTDCKPSFEDSTRSLGRLIRNKAVLSDLKKRDQNRRINRFFDRRRFEKVAVQMAKRV